MPWRARATIISESNALHHIRATVKNHAEEEPRRYIIILCSMNERDEKPKCFLFSAWSFIQSTQSSTSFNSFFVNKTVKIPEPCIVDFRLGVMMNVAYVRMQMYSQVYFYYLSS